MGKEGRLKKDLAGERRRKKKGRFHSFRIFRKGSHQREKGYLPSIGGIFSFQKRKKKVTRKITGNILFLSPEMLTGVI